MMDPSNMIKENELMEIELTKRNEIINNISNNERSEQRLRK